METINAKATTGKIVRVLIGDGPEDVGEIAAGLIAETVRGIDEPAISFVGGSTPVPAYRRLVEQVAAGTLSFRKVRAFLVGEWFDLPQGDPRTFRHFLDAKLFDPAGVPKERVHYFEGRVEDHMRTCFEFERALRAVGGIDLQLLGIGANGHIAFNEPGTPVDARTRLIKLSETTRLSYADYFDSLSAVPHYALTQGLANLLESRKVVVLAAGNRKDEAIHRSLKEPVNAELPASCLQHFDGELTYVLDRAAARLLL
jgi:glucosamine-6-phosphate deaminase